MAAVGHITEQICALAMRSEGRLRTQQHHWGDLKSLLGCRGRSWIENDAQQLLLQNAAQLSRVVQLWIWVSRERETLEALIKNLSSRLCFKGSLDVRVGLVVW